MDAEADVEEESIGSVRSRQCCDEKQPDEHDEAWDDQHV